MKRNKLPMWDGMRGGISVNAQLGDLSTYISSADFDYLRGQLSRLSGATTHGNKVSVWLANSDGSNSAEIGVNEHRGRFYFNAHGNPISFLTGQNVVGDIDLGDQCVEFFKAVNAQLKTHLPHFVLPLSIRDAVTSLNINLYSLAFACYSHDLHLSDWTNMRKLLKTIRRMYSSPLQIEGEDFTLQDLLALRLAYEGDYSIRLDKMYNTHRYFSLGLYNKYVQSQAVGHTCPQSLQNHVRYDLTLHNKWLDHNRIRNVAALTKKYGASLHTWVLGVFQQAFLDTKLFYVLQAPNPYSVDTGSFSEWFQQWVTGNAEKPNERQLSWFRRQGLDVSLSHDVHMVILAARMLGNLNSLLIADVAKDRRNVQAQTALSNRMSDGIHEDALKLQNKLPLMLPDFDLDLYPDASL